MTEKVTEPEFGDAGEGLILGQDETSPIGGKEIIIPDEEEQGQDNKTSAENQSSDNNQSIVNTTEWAGYTTFASLLRDAGLEDTLNNGGPYTVFAPTDMAFDGLPEGMLDNLRNDQEKLNRMLTYHVVNGKYRVEALKNMNNLTSLETGELTVSTTTNGLIMVESAIVIDPDIIASNGVIHGTDKVMIPPGV